MPRGETQRDIISSIAAHHFGQGVVDTLDIIPGWGDLDTLNTTNSLDAWYKLFDAVPDYSPEGNIQSGEQIQSIRTEVNAFLGQHNIDLAAIEKGRITMPLPLATLFAELHQQAIDIAIRNIRLVKDASKKIPWFGRVSDERKTLAFSYGFEGLLLAAKRYNPWFGDTQEPIAFTTYAVPSIIGMMKRGLSKRDVVSTPVYMQEIMNIYFRTIEYLQQQIGSFTHEQVVAVVDYYLEKRIMPNRSVLDTVFGRQNTRSFDRLNERIIAAFRADHVVSTDEERQIQTKRPVTDGGIEEGFIAMIGDELVGEEDPYREVFENERHKFIKRAMELLSPKERNVLELRFGLVDGQEWTLGQVGNKFGINPERVRNIEARALRKLRHPTRRRDLADFIE